MPTLQQVPMPLGDQVLLRNLKLPLEGAVCLSDGERGVPFSGISLSEDFSIDPHPDGGDTGNSIIFFVYKGVNPAPPL